MADLLSYVLANWYGLVGGWYGIGWMAICATECRAIARVGR
jgi:hypothetical protein